jgi:predicted phage tail protein
MTENKAQILNVVIGIVVTCGSVNLLGAIGAAERFQAVAAMLGLVGCSFMVGVITEHYHCRAEAEGKDPDERFKRS